MHLKTIELSGFKSFADKTVLNFGEGITAIVGPNGCGKTNITDAIKWVLGEQSAKSLRGTKMEDVIFNGTSERSPTSISEIMIAFDNSKNVLPIDYSEISIARRLFRTGESEYQLNKIPVRLKDIKDLFLDTGLGTNSYSIMEQGEIDFILQSKPQERRCIFEEVAGVSKYKSKREEALKKLEKVGQDMLRLNDILLELENQKSKLDTQARKARQYQKYLSELKTHEVNSLVKKYLEIKETNSTKSKELKKINEKYSDISLEIDKLDTNYSELKITLTLTEDELISKRTQTNKIESSIAILNERILSAKTTITENLARNSELEQEIKQGQIGKNNYENELSLVRSELDNIEKIVPILAETLAKKTEQKNKLNLEIVDLNLRIENLRQLIFTTATELSEFHNRKTSIDSDIKEMNSHIEKQKIQEQETLTKKMEQEKIINGLREKINGINLTIDELKKKNKNLVDKKNQLHTNIEKNQNELFSKKELAAQLTAQTEALIQNSNYELNQKIKETFEGRVYGTVCDVISVCDENISAVQMAIGEKSDYLICDTESTATEVIDWLKTKNYGWATFLIMSEIERLQIDTVIENKSVVLDEANNLEEHNKKIADLIDCDTKFKKIIEFLVNDVIIKNDNIYNRGIVTGGVIKNWPKNGLKTSIEINCFKNKTATINDEINSLIESIKNYQNEISSIDTELTNTITSTETQNSELIQITTELAMTEESLKTSVNYSSILSCEYENLKNQKTEKESEIVLFTERISKINEQENSAKIEFSQLNNHIKELQSERELLDCDLTNAQVDFSVKNSQLENIKEKIETTNGAFQYVSEKIERANKYLNDSIKKIAVMEKIIFDSTFQINEIVVSKDIADDVIKNIEKKRDGVKNKIIELENILKSHRMKQGILQDEIRTIEKTISSTTSEMRQIESRMKEEKEIAIEDAVNSYKEVQLEYQEVEKLKKKIDILGAVNLAAPEEYEQLEQRYNFLMKQKDDLEKAREDLHNAINKINITTRHNFQKTFVQVRENFKSIFTQLFEGGQADLFFIDEGNLLETGIDIIAQPPGKKLQHISLLSGGEKSLTAIAILFAIYLIKPAPFCILDEIDGQLDEANVLRFTRMLKEFAKTSQFLIITHNKRTMESANALYGVTMEEPGVSKIISVHLEGFKEKEYLNVAN
ncbi:MAG: chromosome segregation protein SMC [Elusimicrobiota bacterium]